MSARRTAALLCALSFAFLLAACGGGDCDAECKRDFEPVDCAARPELCV